MQVPPERALRVGDGLFEPLKGELRLNGRTVKLRPRTAALLSYLVTHGDRVVQKDELMRAVWPDAIVTEGSIVQCVKEIRQAFGDSGRGWIRTMPRQGYAFVGNAPCECEPLAAPQPVAAVAASRLESFQDGWRLLGAGAALAALVAGVLGWYGWSAGPNGHAAPPLSIIVMPVANATGDPARDNAVDDFTEALTDALARTAGTTVIAPGTAFTFKGKAFDARRVGTELNVRYLLEGSLRLEDAEPVLTMRLADTGNAVQLWNQEFRPAGAATLRDLVASRVANTLGIQLMRAEAAGRRTPPADPADLMTQARAAVRSGDEASPRARMLLEAVVQQDEDAQAWAMLATSYVWAARLSPTRERDLEQARRAIERALALAPDNEKVRVAEGRVYGEAGIQRRALAAYERAIALNPSSADAHGGRGDALIMLGRPDEALAPIERAMRISPYDARLFVWQTYAGVAHLHLGHDAAAVELFSKVVAGYPQVPFFRLFLAGALGVSGRVQEARAEMEQLLRMQPELTLSRFRSVEPSDAPAFFKQRQHLYDGLRLAGMPE